MIFCTHAKKNSTLKQKNFQDQIQHMCIYTYISLTSMLPKPWQPNIGTQPKPCPCAHCLSHDNQHGHAAKAMACLRACCLGHGKPTWAYTQGHGMHHGWATKAMACLCKPLKAMAAPGGARCCQSQITSSDTSYSSSLKEHLGTNPAWHQKTLIY